MKIVLLIGLFFLLSCTPKTAFSKNPLRNNSIAERTANETQGAFAQKKINVLLEVSNEEAPLLAQAMQDAKLSFWSNYPDTVLAQAIVDKMTNEELLAQLFMFGWAGDEPKPLVRQWVRERTIGSVKVFGWNTEDVHAVARGIILLQNIAKTSRFAIPLYVATDQEGGWIRHVKGTTSDTPGNMAIGASGYPIDAYLSGYYIARELRALGINMNFAPTVDLYTNYQSTVIGTRSFGEESSRVGVLGVAFTEGTLAAGVIPTAKHYPGHGATDLDSHGRLPIIDIDEQTLFNRELVPFNYLIKEEIPAIMSGHLGFPQITKNNEPASLSKICLQDILRTTLGFKGLIITDDMMMNGATIYAGSLSQGFRMAIEAGNQIICSSTTPQMDEALWQNNVHRMKINKTFQQIVKKSAYKVILSKLQYFKSENAVPVIPDLTLIDKNVPDPDGIAFFTEQAARSITVYKKGSLPLLHENTGRMLLVAQFQQFFDMGKIRFPQSKYYFFKFLIGPNETRWNMKNLFETAQTYDTIIMCVANDESALIAKNLQKLHKKVIIISSLSPMLVMNDFDWAESIILTYSYSAYSFAAAFSAIAGDFEATGRLPLAMHNLP